MFNQNRIIRGLFLLNIAIVSLVVIQMALPYVGIKTWKISGLSMYPTLDDGDLQVNFATGDYEKGDIVCIVAPDGDGFWVKRVIGTPGDTIEVWGSYIEVNGEPDPISKNYEKSLTKSTVTVLLYNEYFVSGDNRGGSYDSRYIGPIQLENILSERLFSF
jgi:signal peptidase I